MSKYVHEQPMVRSQLLITVTKGKIVLVTGGAKGIGRMISEGFVQNGATVYISSRDVKACEQACRELNALGKGKADFIAADLYKEDAAKNIADELKKRAGSKSSQEMLYLTSCRKNEGLLTTTRARCPRQQQR
jgi:NAD(P)-dependent dehydrogenase (short-subunit alcohol dehydrogenase family)